MSRLLLIVVQSIFAIILLAIASPYAPAQITPLRPHIIETVDRSIVQVTVAQRIGNTTASGWGSGIIVDRGGLILTAAHVVNRAVSLQVLLRSGQAFPARIVGVDRLYDAALLRIGARRLPAISLGSSAGLRLGNPVAAFGRSRPHRQFGPTLGTVAEFDLETRPGVPHLRTTAIAWIGDSGGALVNTRGEVIGMISAVTVSYRDWAASFALAVDVIKTVLPDLKTGTVHHPWLGILGATVTEQLARELGLAVRGGVLVLEVTKGSPAAQAGLQGKMGNTAQGVGEAGDVITAIDRQAAASFGSLSAHVYRRHIGDVVTLEVNRGGHVFTVAVTLGQQPAR